MKSSDYALDAGPQSYHFVIHLLFPFVVTLNLHSNDSRLIDEFLNDAAILSDYFAYQNKRNETRKALAETARKMIDQSGMKAERNSSRDQWQSGGGAINDTKFM